MKRGFAEGSLGRDGLPSRPRSSPKRVSRRARPASVVDGLRCGERSRPTGSSFIFFLTPRGFVP